MDARETGQFVSMYVNHWTLGYGDKGEQAVQLLLDEGFRNGILPYPTQAEFVA